MSTHVAPDFEAYPKTPRLFRGVVVTEKIDGSNSCVYIDGSGFIRAGSRNRWITPTDDNYGFAAWVDTNRLDLLTLGPGRHFGEWWGGGIQRGYGLHKHDKRFSLFNVARWADGAVTQDRWEKGKLIPGGQPLPPRPACCGVVPVLYQGPFCTQEIEQVVADLRRGGSLAVPGYMKPEGVIVFHTAANCAFKVLLENDGEAKGE